MAKSTVITGSTGEHFVAAELQRHGFTVAFPPVRTEDIDLLVMNRKSKIPLAIQVKTTKGSQKKWMLNKKNERITSPGIFYVFVSLNDNGTPSYHVVPSDIVAKAITLSHDKWLASPGKHGQKHTDTAIRTFEDKDDEYLDRWDLLES